jgi:antitoxin (DNA-binding transcriptional repressor) of toxin-antitoxin stability system
MEYRLVTPKNVIHISVAEAASDFASLLVRVRMESAEFVIEEQGRPVAALSPVEPRTQE